MKNDFRNAILPLLLVLVTAGVGGFVYNQQIEGTEVPVTVTGGEASDRIETVETSTTEQPAVNTTEFPDIPAPSQSEGSAPAPATTPTPTPVIVPKKTTLPTTSSTGGTGTTGSTGSTVVTKPTTTTVTQTPTPAPTTVTNTPVIDTTPVVPSRRSRAS